MKTNSTDDRTNTSGGEQQVQPETETGKAKHKKKKGVSTLIPIVAVAVMVFCLIHILTELRTYQQAEEGYDSLLDEAVQLPGDNGDNTLSAENAAAADTEPEAAIRVGVPGVDYPDLTIDYEELQRVNRDFVGVLYVPVLDLVYPVAHSHDNSEYLTTTFYGEYNKCGSIFMDRYSSADYSDGNTFILGHNMRNMSMFGSLKRFEADPELCSQDPMIYVYNEDYVRRYRIFAYYEPSVNDDMYSAEADYNDPDTYDAFVASALRNSHYQTKETFDFSERPRIVTLSTCWATDHTNNLVVHAFLTGEFAQPE